MAKNPIYSQTKIGITVVLISSILIALAPNVAKFAYQNGATPLAVILTRNLTGAVLIAAYLTVRELWPRRGQKLFRQCVFAGLAQLLMAVGTFGSVAYIDVSLAVLIIYLHPFLIALVAVMRDGEKITSIQIICISIAITGLGLVLSVTIDSINPFGIGLAIVGMLAVVAWVFLGATISKEYGPYVSNFYMSIWTLIFLTILVVIGSNSSSLLTVQFPNSYAGWIAILSAGITNTVGFILFFIGAVKIGITRASLLTLSEPVFAILFAVFFLQEFLSLFQWIGVLIVIISLVYFEKRNNTG